MRTVAGKLGTLRRQDGDCFGAVDGAIQQQEPGRDTGEDGRAKWSQRDNRGGSARGQAGLHLDSS